MLRNCIFYGARTIQGSIITASFDPLRRVEKTGYAFGRIGADSVQTIKSYMVAESLCKAKLEDKVNKLISDGWQPIGGVSTSEILDKSDNAIDTETGLRWTYIYSQALVAFYDA